MRTDGLDWVIATVVDDIPVVRVTNWCRHIRARQISVSPAGRKLGLPIGPKEVSCTELGVPAPALMYQVAAESFIETNCVDCVLHSPVDPDNIGAAIVEHVRQARLDRADAEAAAQRTRRELRSLAVEGMDVDTILRDDPESDAEVRSLVSSLADDQRQLASATTLLRAARSWPELFSDPVARVLLGAARDARIGGVVLETVWILSGRIGVLRGEVVAIARSLLDGGMHVETAAGIIEAGLGESLVQPDEALAAALVRCLPPLADTSPFAQRTPGQANSNAVRRALSALGGSIVETVTLRLLVDPRPQLRSKAAAAASELLTTADHAMAGRLVDQLLAGLALLDDGDGADLSLEVALNAAVRARPDETTAQVFGELSLLLPGVATRAIRAFLLPRNQPPADGPWIHRLLTAASDETVDLEVRAAVAGEIEWIADQAAGLLWARFDALLGALLAATDAQARLQATEPGPPNTSPLAQVDLLLARQHSETVVLDLERAVGVAALGNPRVGVDQIGALLEGTHSLVAPALKASLLAALRRLVRKSRGVAPAVVPVVFPFLFDQHSPEVRGAAIYALGEVGLGRRDALPDDVLLAAASLLQDEYLMPVVSGAVWLFRDVVVADRRLAGTVINRLWGLYRAYGRDPVHADIVDDLIHAELNLSGQHPQFVPAQLWALRRMSHEIQPLHTAHGLMDGYGWFVLDHPKGQDSFVESLVDYLIRFRLEVSYSGPSFTSGASDASFGFLFLIRPDVVRERAALLLQFAGSGYSRRVPLHVATLLTAVADPRAAEAFEVAADALPAGGRFAWERARDRGLAVLLRAEAAVEAGERVRSLGLFRDALELLQAGRPPTTSQVGLEAVGLEDDEPDLSPWEPWTRLRTAWVELPARAPELSDHLERMRIVLGALPDANYELDGALFGCLGTLVDALDFAARWYAAVRTPDPNTAGLRDAMLAHLRDALAMVREIDAGADPFAALARSIEAALVAAGELSATSSLEHLIQPLRQAPFPIPLGGLPLPYEWRGPSLSRRDGMPETAQPHEASRESPALPLAVVTMRVDGVDASGTVTIAAGRTYDIEIELQLDEPPLEAGELLLEPVSTLPRSDYEFPEAPQLLVAGQTRYVVPGVLRFLYPQSETSAPKDIKLLATIRSPEDVRDLELFGHRSLRVRVLPETAVSSPPSAAQRAPHAAAVVLTPDEELEDEAAFVREGLQSRLEIRVTGRRRKQRNIVEVGGHIVELSLSDFRGFMVLVAGVFQSKGGWVSRRALRSGDGLQLEGQFFPSGIDAALNRLRTAFQPALDDLEPLKFIEASGDGQVRLSTHASLISYDTQLLSAHPSPAVREVAAILPQRA